MNEVGSGDGNKNKVGNKEKEKSTSLLLLVLGSDCPGIDSFAVPSLALTW